MSSPPPAPAPSIPDYELLRAIGRGSYGEVWLARSVTGVFRVIKIVRRDRFDDERPYLRELEGITRFQTAASGRPRQLALLHVGRNDQAGYFYYVMEPADDVETGSEIIPDKYIPLTLKELFSRRGRLPAAECIHLALELARGLAVLHAANLIHRDIKPSNIIFVQRVPKLADVGLVASSEATMTCAGTPGYAPREGAGTVAADIFSLGKVLYEITTGLDRMEFPRLPVELADATDSAIFRELNSIILRACHPDPEERQPSADALARDLELVQAGRSVAFYEALRRRTRAIAISAAVLTLLAGLGTTLLYWRSSILQRANQRARHALYRSDLAVAQLARASGDLGRARAALARQIPQPGETDLRGIEWAILQHSVRGEGTPLEPATNGVAVTSLAVDPTGRWLAASFADQSAALWNLHSGKIERRLGKVDMIRGFQPSGAILAQGLNQSIINADIRGQISVVASNANLLHTHAESKISFTDSPTNAVVHILDLKSGKSSPPLDFGRIAAPGLAVCIAISDDLKSAIFGVLQEDGIRRERKLVSIDIPTMKERWRTNLSERIIWSERSPDDLHVLVNVGSLSPRLQRFDSADAHRQLIGHTARVQAAHFSTTGRMVATGSSDQTVRIWEVRTGRALDILRGLGHPITSVHWTPDEKRVVAGDDSGSIRIFDVQSQGTNEVLPGFYSDVHGDLVYSTDSSRIAATVTTNSISIFEIANPTDKLLITNSFQPIAFLASPNQLKAISSDFRICTIEPPNKKPSRVSEPVLPSGFSLRSWSMSPDGKTAALTGGNGEISIIDLNSDSAQLQKDPRGKEIWATSFTPAGDEIWGGTTDGRILKWRTSPFSLIEEAQSMHEDFQSFDFSPDGRWLAASVFGDASVRILDRNSQRWVGKLISHRRFVSCLKFTSNSNRLVTGGADGKMIIWRVPEFEELAAFEVESATQPTGDEGIATFKMAPDGRSISALTEDGRIRIWRADYDGPRDPSNLQE